MKPRSTRYGLLRYRFPRNRAYKKLTCSRLTNNNSFSLFTRNFKTSGPTRFPENVGTI